MRRPTIPKAGIKKILLSWINYQICPSSTTGQASAAEAITVK